MSNELPLCKCGCGTPVEKKNKKYFADHFRNPPEKEQVVEKKSVEKESVKKAPIVPAAKKEKPSQLELAQKELDRKTKPIPGGKISKKNLLAVGLGIYT